MVTFNTLRENWCLAFLPSEPQAGDRATAQGSPHLPRALLWIRNALLLQPSLCLKHNIPEDNRELGQLGDTQYPSGTWKPHFHITFNIICRWGDADLDHMKQASFPRT